MGCPHTHDIGVDGCGNGDCTGAENGTIMSYCHGCPGGLANMGLGFCPENIANVANTLANASCDYTVTPETVARDDAASILPGESILIDVLANDAGLDCGDVFLGDFDPSSTLGGTIELVEDGGFLGRPALRYTAPTTTEVADGFQYSVIDAGGTALDGATVDIRIDNPRPPVVVSGDVPGVLGRYYVLSAPGVLPDFELLEPYAESVWSRIDSPSTNGEFADTGRADEVGVVWEGWIDLAESGSWTFGLESDDGSRLWIGDEVVVDNDGLHGMVERTGSISLLAASIPSESLLRERRRCRLHRPSRWPRYDVRRHPRLGLVPWRHDRGSCRSQWRWIRGWRRSRPPLPRLGQPGPERPRWRWNHQWSGFRPAPPGLGPRGPLSGHDPVHEERIPVFRGGESAFSRVGIGDGFARLRGSTQTAITTGS